MNGPYFVMLGHPSVEFVPMMEDDENMATYQTANEARQAAEDSVLGSHFGYEIFCWGEGES
jgi:hypothetical protein